MAAEEPENKERDAIEAEVGEKNEESRSENIGQFEPVSAVQKSPCR